MSRVGHGGKVPQHVLHERYEQRGFLIDCTFYCQDLEHSFAFKGALSQTEGIRTHATLTNKRINEYMSLGIKGAKRTT